MKAKNFLATTMLSLFSSMTYANNTSYFYAGIEGGYDITDFYKTLKIATNSGNKIYDKKDDLPGTGTFIEGNIGYQWNFDKLFLATELSGEISNLKYHGHYVDYEKNEKSRGKLTIDNNLELNLLPGYFIENNVGIYGKIGAAKGSFKYSEYKDDETRSNFGVTERESLYGFVYGLGALLPLQKNLKLRLEYDRILYQTYTNNTFPIAPGQIRTIKFKPTSNQFKIGLIYYFS